MHIHRTVAEVDAHYSLEVGLQGSIGEALDAIAGSADLHAIAGAVPPVRGLVREELERGAADDSFPVKPAAPGGGHPRRRWITRTSCCAIPAR